jgi:hypothetical protein
VFTATLGLVLAVAPIGWAEDNCKPFRALAQATLLPAEGSPIHVSGWQGPFTGTLNGKIVYGYYSVNGEQLPPTQTGVVGKEVSPTERMDFGTDGAFTTIADNKGVFPMPPGKGGFGSYVENTKIAEDTQRTGKFQNATGFLSFTGSFIAYPLTADLNGPWAGVWHAEISGRVCNVLP